MTFPGAEKIKSDAKVESRASNRSKPDIPHLRAAEIAPAIDSGVTNSKTISRRRGQVLRNNMCGIDRVVNSGCQCQTRSQQSSTEK